MQGKGKFEIEFKTEFEDKKRVGSVSNRAYLQMNFIYVMFAICTYQVQLYYIMFMFLILPKCIYYVPKRKALLYAELFLTIWLYHS